jgi:hypothetical protein
MRKQVIPIPQIAAAWDQACLDLNKAALVEVSSEDQHYPIELRFWETRRQAGVRLSLEPPRLSGLPRGALTTGGPACAANGSSYRSLGVSGTAQSRVGNVSHARRDRVHQFPRIWKFQSTLQADLIRPFLDGEYTAQAAVMTPESKLDNPMHQKQWPHTSSIR